MSWQWLRGLGLMTSLTELDLSGNQIVQGWVGRKLFRLKDQSDGLRVDNNKANAPVDSVGRVGLATQWIDTVSVWFSKESGLKSLDVSNNNIELIQLSDVPTALESIYVQNRLQSCQLTFNLAIFMNFIVMEILFSTFQKNGFIPLESYRWISRRIRDHRRECTIRQSGKSTLPSWIQCRTRLGRQHPIWQAYHQWGSVSITRCPSHRRPVPNDLFRAIRWCVETST